MRCPSCNKIIDKNSGNCKSCGMFAPGAKIFANAGSFSKWKNQDVQLKEDPAVSEEKKAVREMPKAAYANEPEAQKQFSPEIVSVKPCALL